MLHPEQIKAYRAMTPEQKLRTAAALYDDQPFPSVLILGSTRLAIVRSIVQDHRGHIRASDNQPQGTRFVVEFPLPGART